MYKILIVEDEKPIVKLLKYNLEQNGYATLVASDGETALSLVRHSKPDLVLLDLMLPKIDGLEVCKSIRKNGNIPIIMLTAKREEADRVVGLELGADDYLTKPFSVRELLARIKSVLRRATEKKFESKVVRLGKLEVDLERYVVKVGDKAVELSSKEFEFLKAFVQANGKVLAREQLLESVWGYDKGVEIDTRTIDQHVARLRGKLGSESGRLVTVKNIGYRLKTD